MIRAGLIPRCTYFARARSVGLPSRHPVISFRRVRPHQPHDLGPGAGILSNQKKAKVGSSPADTRSMSSINAAFPSFSLPSAQNSGRAALATSTQQLNHDAQQIANPAEGDLATPLLDSSQSLLLAQAGAQVIRTSNQTIGTLLDI